VNTWNSALWYAVSHTPSSTSANAIFVRIFAGAGRGLTIVRMPPTTCTVFPKLSNHGLPSCATVSE
jgi:hypothetical protein